MNLIQIQEQLKGLPTNAIMSYAQGQNPEVPPYVALAELNRRKQMQSGVMAGQGGQKPTIKDQIEQSTGLLNLQNSQKQQAMQQMAQPQPQAPVPQGAPQGPVQGAPQEGFAGGGAIAFDAGGMPPDVGPNDVSITSPDDGGGVGLTDEEKQKLAELQARKQAAESTGIKAALASRAAKPQTPPPAVVAQQVAQGTPAQRPQSAEMQDEISKYGLAALRAKPDLKADMATAASALLRDPLEAELEKNLRDKRAADLAARETPKNWYENKGLIAALSGFAQSDPRRPYGAFAAASNDFDEKQRTQRNQEDALFREGLAGLSKSAQERVKSQFDYAVGRGKDDAVAKREAASTMAGILNNQETNATHRDTSTASNANALKIAQLQLQGSMVNAAAMREQKGDLAGATNIRKYREDFDKRVANIEKNYAGKSYDPKAMAAKTQEIQDTINQFTTMVPELKGTLGGNGGAGNAGGVDIKDPKAAAAYAKYAK